MADRKPTINDGDTRKHILRLLLEHNPASATFIADTLGLSAASVRRHIDTLVDESLARTAPTLSTGPRGQSRPAKPYCLTDRGRARFGRIYDDFTSAALTAPRKAGGEQAVAQLAHQRIGNTLLGVTPVGQDAEKEKVVKAVVDAFRRARYAATINQNTGGVQICQHHCLISHVASEFPELYATRHEAVGELLGRHTQPLAAIADGNGICTTNIPLIPVTKTLTESSQEGNGE